MIKREIVQYLVVCPRCGAFQRQTAGEDVTHCIKCSCDLTFCNLTELSATMRKHLLKAEES